MDIDNQQNLEEFIDTRKALIKKLCVLGGMVIGAILCFVAVIVTPYLFRAIFGNFNPIEGIKMYLFIFSALALGIVTIVIGAKSTEILSNKANRVIKILSIILGAVIIISALVVVVFFSFLVVLSITQI